MQHYQQHHIKEDHGRSPLVGRAGVTCRTFRPPWELFGGVGRHKLADRPCPGSSTSCCKLLQAPPQRKSSFLPPPSIFSLFSLSLTTFHLGPASQPPNNGLKPEALPCPHPASLRVALHHVICLFTCLLRYAATPVTTKHTAAMSSSDISSAAHAVSESLSATMKASPEALPSAFTRAQEVVAAQGSSSWLGLFGRLILAILSLISSILYWAIRIVTITIPTVLFTLFSTSWTVTMNATTLYALHHSTRPPLSFC